MKMTGPGLERIVLDAYAWVEYFTGSTEGRKAKEYIDGEYLLLTPAIVVAELSDKYRRTNMEEEWRLRRVFLRLQSDILDLSYNVAEHAGTLKRRLRQEHSDVGLADAVILSHAREEHAQLVTGDSHLTGEDDVIDISP
jgi:predicted nucleic acid-binding protein